MKKKILIVEDDKEISELVTSHLEQEHFTVMTAFDGEEALQLFQTTQIDLVLLDLMLPKLNGMEFLRKIRETSVVPVLIISAKDSEFDKTLGLGFGADDYISKPFSVIELTARVQAAIRRATRYVSAGGNSSSNMIQFKALTLNLETFTAQVNGKNIQLTSKEFYILKLFMMNQNRVFTKEQLYELIWEDDYFGNENVINVHIRRLREKIEEDPSKPSYIQTVWGIGYKLGE
ncbi:response regulator transcription factor [Piscibacillus salipiscarius]|uniref:Response regulator transcription factor n=1 Tax=Piscibacillus salipiscarius TaxID=299480 RepID=A0ABW5QEP1_9BACI|nr:response regulator transcription factor [Piscibacillus salipiscarius]